MEGIEKEIITILEDFTGDYFSHKEGFSLDTKLFEDGLGWDSLEMLEAIYLIEDKFNIIIDPENLKDLKTVRGITECVKTIMDNK